MLNFARLPHYCKTDVSGSWRLIKINLVVTIFIRIFVVWKQ